MKLVVMRGRLMQALDPEGDIMVDVRCNERDATSAILSLPKEWSKSVSLGPSMMFYRGQKMPSVRWVPSPNRRGGHFDIVSLRVATQILEANSGFTRMRNCQVFPWHHPSHHLHDRLFQIYRLNWPLRPRTQWVDTGICEISIRLV